MNIEKTGINQASEQINFDPVQNFPTEIALLILSQLDLSDIGNCFLVNRNWHSIATDKTLLRTLLLKNPLYLKRAAASSSPTLKGVLNQDDINLYNNLTLLGPSEWKKHFGDIGKVKPLPCDIQRTLATPCPIFEKVKIVQSHALVYIPKSINGIPLTFRSLVTIIQQKFQNILDKSISESILKASDNTTINESQWILITKTVIPSTRLRNFNIQKNIIQELKENSGINYQLPKAVHCLAFLALYYLKNGRNLFAATNVPTTTRCEDMTNSKTPVALGYLQPGYEICLTDGCFVGANCYGIAPMVVV